MNLVNSQNCIFFIVDIQEKLSLIASKDELNNAFVLAKTAEILNIPTIVTEQYPKGLGKTVPQIKEATSCAKYFEKNDFNALNSEEIKIAPESENKKQIIIFGIETHICVLQTAFSLRNEGYDVFVAEDACASRKEHDKVSALKRLRHSGIQTVTTEQVVFELLGSAKHPKFKEIQSLIK